jgi:predicted outer membrane protein
MPELSLRTSQLIDQISDTTLRQQVLTLLSNNAALFGPPTPEMLDQAHFAVIKLAMAGPRGFERAGSLHMLDTRDLLVNAEFANETKAREKWYRSIR